MTVSDKRVILTGFMGVGKSSVARHLSFMLGCETIDLDYYIEEKEKRTVGEIFQIAGEAGFRRMETENLVKILDSGVGIISLGGGTWMIEENRRIIKNHGCTSVWLESDFEHCWRNIRTSKRERPLAADKRRARKLFEERQKIYCLADWHFIIKPEFTSFEVARRIAEEVFQKNFN
jgi:shikimate kinase